MDYGYQKYYLEQVKKHKKSILIWFRQSGKSQLIIDSLIDYVSKNYDKNILVITIKKEQSKRLQERLHQKLNLQINKRFLSEISKNRIFFESINTFKNTIRGRNIDIILVDDFEYIKDLHIFLVYVGDSELLLTSSQFNTEMVTYVDREGDCYLGVVSFSSIANEDKVLERISNSYIRDRGAYNISNEYGNIVELYDGLGIKKDRNLIDVWGLKIQRRKKLEEIAKKIKENDEN